MSSIVPNEHIASKIIMLRGEKVILGKDLAVLYGVENKALTRAVQRNVDRFPEDFMFQISKSEFEILKCHFGTSSWGGVRKLPYVFTEHGILMLSSVLRSKKAVEVNIQIMRMFAAMRKMLQENSMLFEKLESLEYRFSEYDEQLQEIRFTIRQMLREEEENERKIGFDVKHK